MDEILKKIDAESELYRPVPKNSSSYCQGEYKGYVDGLQKAKEIILSQQKESKGSVIIALSEGEYIHRCLNCNNQIMSISGSLNFCPTCGKEVEPLHMASGEIVFSEIN